MFNEVKKSIKWGEETLTLETGKIARQADSTVIATYGETSVLAAVCFAKKEKEGQSFFPLTVNYQEKYSILRFDCFKANLEAGIGPVSINTGSSPTTVIVLIRALGLVLIFLRPSSLHIIIADAPSVI